MKNLFLVFIFLFVTSNSNAQINLDSLFGIWNDTSQQDTIRLATLSKICNIYRINQPDSTYYYADKLYHFAREVKNDNYKANALNLKGLSHLLSNDSLALIYFQQSLEIYEKMESKFGIASILLNKGIIYIYQSNYIKALDYNMQSLKIYEEIQNRGGIANTTHNIGYIYKKQSNYSLAIDYFQRSLAKHKEIENKHGIGNTLNNIGGIYLTQKNYPLALNYYQRSLNVYEEIQNKAGMANNLTNIGIINREKGNDSLALDYYQRSLKIHKETKNTISIGKTLGNIGNIYLDRNNYSLALEYYQKSSKTYKSIGHKRGTLNNTLNLGRIYKDQGKIRKATIFFNKALKIARETGSILHQKDACGLLYENYKSQGNGTKALEYHEEMVLLKDSLSFEDTDKKLQKMEFTNQMIADSLAYVKKELNLELIHQKELYKKDQTRNILLASGIIFFLLTGGLWNRNRYTRRTNRQLAIAKERAEQSEKHKEQFLANMSHEIRTPMHAISGMVKILKRKEHLPAQYTFLNAMKTSSDNLIVILNDVLDLSKIEAGKLDIESISTSPTAVIENVIQILKFKAEEKGLGLSYKVDDNVPDLVMGDPTRLNQILVNLTGNAIKFTENGSVDILLQKENGQLKYSIKDTGIGIPNDKLESIFGAFEQAKDSIARNYAGTGLGLSISKQLVELQNGKIWVESKEGQGSTFHVELPIIVAATDAIDQGLISKDRLKTMAASLNGIRILLAEDNDFNQMIAQDDLSFYIKDVKIDIAKNGVIAFELFKKENYDLILMDVQMPEMNGFETTKRIRELESTNNTEKPIPIIAMTASLLKTEIESCYNVGMNNYIPKPYKVEELIGAIYSAITKNQY